MPLSVGDKLGRYEILERIGVGGMGEVYLARDTELGREVALKTSAQRFSERFEREAKLISSLNHPNICTLFDVGPDYLVMEHIEGHTLEERIQQGPLPEDEALDIACQIGLALEEAHGKQIVHRDLKPGNVKIRPDGVVKVLDFGLAKAFVESRAGSDDTRTLGQTEAGMVLGTPAYMSPEQARGQKVDKRADIWSFGVLLYEMLTAKKVFQGQTTIDILSEVVNKEPDWQPVPAKLQPLLKRCLEKDPKKRLRDISSLEFLLTEAPSVPAASRSRLEMVGWAVAALLACALGIALWAPWRAQTSETSLVRLDVDLGPDVSLSSTAQWPEVIISPDGSRLVYVAQGRLVTRRLDQAKATELPGTEGANNPFFSPDGEWVAFFARGKLNKISLGGGTAVPLADAVVPDNRGGSWGEDGSIVIGFSSGGGLSRITATGGAPTALTERAPGEISHAWPQVLPGAKAVLFSVNASRVGWDNASIVVISLADRSQKTLLRGGTFGRYLQGSNGKGQLVYVSRGTLFATPFDLGSLEVRGTPMPVLEDVSYNASTGSAQFDFARSGTLLYRSGAAAGFPTFRWLDSAGNIRPLLVKQRIYQQGRLSPDGQRLALSVTEGSKTDLHVYDTQRDTLTRLTFDGQGGGYPVWSPDARFIVFSRNETIYWTRADGGSQPQLLVKAGEGGLPFSFTSDGKRLAFMARDGSGRRYQVWTVPIENGGASLKAGKREHPLPPTDFDERQPTFSPDGRWLAYVSDESGIFEVYVRPFPATSSSANGKWQISNSGGMYPQWSRTAPELFFRTQDTRILMVANYTVKGDSFVTGKPRVWSDKQLADTNVPYDLAPDGKRVAALMPPEEQQSPRQVTFLMNFFDELRRKVPAGK